MTTPIPDWLLLVLAYIGLWTTIMVLAYTAWSTMQRGWMGHRLSEWSNGR